MTIEERAKESWYKRYPEGDIQYRDAQIDGYIQGATDQDPISRADQKKIDIEKVQKAICERICKCKRKCKEPNTNCDMIWFITQAMGE